MFWRMTPLVRRDSASASATPFRSSPISAMSAVSSATSVPAAPMAMPTSAIGQRRGVVDAVADHHHRTVALAQLAHGGGLLLRQQLGQRRCRRRRRGRSLRPTARVSPVSTATWAMPASRMRRTASAACGRRRSATAMTPSGRNAPPLPSQRRRRAGSRPPSASRVISRASGLGRSSVPANPSSRARRMLPTTISRPPIRADGALAGHRQEALRHRDRRSRPRAPCSAIARASGCSDSASTAAAAEQDRSSIHAARQRHDRRPPRGGRW